MSSLARAFLALAECAAPAGQLERALGAALQTGREAWPALPLAEQEFVAHLAQRAPAGGDVLAWLGSVHAADLYLACACARLHPAALAAFDQRLLAEVPSYLARRRTPPELGEEVRQLLRERLLLPARGGALPRIAGYSGRGPLAAWVRVAALRVLATLTRRPRPEVALAEDDVPAGLAAHDPELHLLQGRHGAEVTRSLRDAFESLQARDRAVLRLHFLDGLNLERLGMTFQVSRATAGRMVLGARQRLLDQTLALLRQRLGLGAAELESLLGALRSKIDVSLHALLREPEG